MTHYQKRNLQNIVNIVRIHEFLTWSDWHRQHMDQRRYIKCSPVNKIVQSLFMIQICKHNISHVKCLKYTQVQKRPWLLTRSLTLMCKHSNKPGPLFSALETLWTGSNNTFDIEECPFCIHTSDRPPLFYHIWSLTACLPCLKHQNLCNIQLKKETKI